MPRTKLTNKAIERLPAPDPTGRQTLYWDIDLRGFGCLCSGKSKAKTYVVQRDLPDGRTRRVTIGPTNVLSLDEARRRAEQVLADFYKGIDPKQGRRSGSTTLRQVLDDYIVARKDLRDKSHRDYRRSVERYLASWLDRPLRDLTAEMVEARHRSIAAEVARGGRYSGEATANSAMRALRVLWNFAADDRVLELPTNPVKRLRKQWFSVPRRESLVRADQLPKFYQGVIALPNPIARAYILLLLFTGLRREEAAGLRWEDVDFETRVIRLPASKTKARRKLDLPMSDFVLDLLVGRRAAGREEFVFPSSGKSGHIAEPKFPLTQVAQVTGIRVSAHDLRRTFVTAAESADISPLALKALVNHAVGNDITSGYVIMTVERLREPAQRVCDHLKKLCRIEPAERINISKLL